MHDDPDIHLSLLADDLNIVAVREGVRFIDEVIWKGNDIKNVVLEDYPVAVRRDSDDAMRKFIVDRVSTGYRRYFPCWMTLSHILTGRNKTRRSMWHMSHG